MTFQWLCFLQNAVNSGRRPAECRYALHSSQAALMWAAKCLVFRHQPVTAPPKALMLLLRTRKFTSTSYQHIKTDMKCSFTKSTSGLLHTDHDPSLSMAAAPSLSHTCLAMISNMTLGRTSFQAAWGKSLTNFSTWKMFSGLTQR